MLQFLQSGKALYVLAAVCIIGAVSKLITRGLYKRLIKETDNMAMTKNQNMKALKQKLENAYRLNQAIVNTQAYLEKQLYGFKFMRLSLDGWSNLSSQAAILILFLGGAGAFFSYWYGIDAYYIVLYASVGVLGSLFVAFVDSSANIPLKKQQLFSALQEYMDNSVFVRAARDRENGTESAGTSLKETARAAIRDNGVKEAKVRELTARDAKKRPAVREEAAEDGKASQKEGRTDIDYLKRSLEQIAASREKERTRENWAKNLDPDEIKVLGEIIRDYFGNA